MALSAALPHYTRSSAVLLAEEPADPPFQKEKERTPGWSDLYLHYEQRLASLWTWRLSWWETWAEIARYMLPRRYHHFITANTYDRGLRRDWAIVDSTATLDGQTCAAGMMSGLTDPDRPWLRLGPAIPGIELDRAGQMWYDDLTDRLRYIHAESNFYDSLAVHYEDLVFFGNAPVIDYEDADDLIHCFNPCAGEYFLVADNNFEVGAIYREFRLTMAQAVEQFGLENCPADIREAWRQKGGALEGELVIGHAIEPNFAVRGKSGKDVGQIPGGYDYREHYWVRGKTASDGPLSEAGFFGKPFAVSRWNTVSNDAYARGLGHDALPDTIQLQLETRQKAEALEKVVRPPMVGDIALKNQPTSIRAGGITYADLSKGKPMFYSAFETFRPDIPGITADLVDVRDRIGRAFFTYLFRMMEGLRDKTRGQVTATEIDALKAEQLMLLGPVISRILNEGIRPRIHRHLQIMAKRGLIPPKPPSLQRVPLKVEFISMLTMAQRAAATASIERAFAFTAQISPLWPKAKLNLDENEAVREHAELHGVPARIIRSPRVVKQLSDQMDKAAAAAAAAQTAMAGVEGAKGLSQASLEGNNALTALTGGGPGVGGRG